MYALDDVMISSVASKTGFTKKDAKKAINAVFSATAEVLESKENLTVIGFGTFKHKHREERKGRNPQTGAEITIPASNTAGFNPGTALKEALNK